MRILSLPRPVSIFVTRLLVFLPVIEILFIVGVAHVTGILAVFAALALGVMGGIALMRMAGRETLAALRHGQTDTLFATTRVFSGLCLCIAGLLFIFPGFISDIMAILLLLPPCRNGVFRRMKKQQDDAAGVIDGTYTYAPDNREPAVDILPPPRNPRQDM